MTDEALDAKLTHLYRTAFDPLHAGYGAAAPRPAAPRHRRVLRPVVVLALCLALLCGGAVGAGAAGLLRSRTTLFGGPVILESGTGAYHLEQSLPEGCVAHIEFDHLFYLQNVEGTGAGAYILRDGRVFVRRAGEAQDEDITDRFTGESYLYTYPNRATGGTHSVTVLGEYTVPYQRYDGPATVTMTRVQDEDGAIAYLLHYSYDPYGVGSLYNRFDFDPEIMGDLLIDQAGLLEGAE